VKDEKDKNVFPLSKIPSNKTRTLREHEGAYAASSPATAAEREFIDAAKTHTVPTSKVLPDWRAFDPDDKPTRGINVRFNEHELVMLRHIARAQGRSIHQVIKRLLVPAARKELE
jgi:hypothetical protein